VTFGAAGGVACGGFGFASNTPATFDVFCRLQITNNCFLYVLFDSAPSGPDCIDVWDLSLHRQMASPKLLRSDVLQTSRGGSKRKKVFAGVRDLIRINQSPLFENSNRNRLFAGSKTASKDQ